MSAVLKPEMVFAREKFSDGIEEATAFAKAHYEEAQTALPEMKLALDFDTYLKADNAGILRSFTARENGVLLGYATFLVAHTNFKHKGLHHAIQDSFYMHSEYRTQWLAFFNYIETSLVAEGVKLIVAGVPERLRVLFERMRYRATEVKMMKWVA